jgi:hypothetical protein
MKKILLIICLLLLASILSAQKKTNYEKYWQAREDSITKSQTTLSNNATENQITSAKPEYDDLYYQPGKDISIVKKHKKVNTEDTLRAIVDTLVNENPDISINYMYNDDLFFYSNHLGMFYHGGFNYWHYNPFFYNPWYDWNWNPYYGNPWRYGNLGFYDGYYFGYNSYWGWNFGWNWYHPYYHNNYWHGQHNNFYGRNNGFNQQPQYGHRERPSNNQIDNRRTQPQERKITGRDPNNRPTYNNERRAYTPSYNNPRMSTRPQYNNTRVNLIRENTNRYQTNSVRPDVRSQQYRNTENRKSGIQSNIRGSETRIPVRSYTTPSRSYGESRTINNNGQNSGANSSRSFSGSNGSSNSSGGRSSGSSSGSGSRSGTSGTGRR